MNIHPGLPDLARQLGIPMTSLTRHQRDRYPGVWTGKFLNLRAIPIPNSLWFAHEIAHWWCARHLGLGDPDRVDYGLVEGDFRRGAAPPLDSFLQSLRVETEVVILTIRILQAFGLRLNPVQIRDQFRLWNREGTDLLLEPDVDFRVGSRSIWKTQWGMRPLWSCTSRRTG